MSFRHLSQNRSQSLFLTLAILGRAFIISNCDVSVSSFSIINGNGSVIGVFNVGTAGGAIASDKATLTITDVTFENCNTPGFTYSAPAGALLTRVSRTFGFNFQFRKQI
jgi:hypothetical protein